MVRIARLAVVSIKPVPDLDKLAAPDDRRIGDWIVFTTK
jgi:hypothetical protein